MRSEQWMPAKTSELLAALGTFGVPFSLHWYWEKAFLWSVWFAAFEAPWLDTAVALCMVEPLTPVALGCLLPSTLFHCSNFHKADAYTLRIEAHLLEVL